MKISVPVCGAYMLWIDISSWWMVSLINMKWPSLSHLIDFRLKSTLSDMNITTHAYLWGQFAWKTFFQPLTLSQCLFFSVRWVSCKQHTIGSYYLTQFAILCLLIGALSPFTFIVNIERCLLFPVILACLSLSSSYSLFTALLAHRVYSFFSLPISF
jgi:hypothetical protein